MKKKKKSFVGYCDWRNTFDLLSDDEAGKLIKHFFAYVSDENPVLDDRLLQMAFEPIKTQLKRDLSKYEEVKKKRAEAGRQGGLRSGENRNKQNEASASDVTDLEANEANASGAKQNEANEADNVNDNGNVNDNVILLEKETKGKNVVDDFSPPSDEKKNSDESEAEKSLSKPLPVIKRKKVARKKENIPEEELMIPEDFKPIWSDWLEYRKAKKKKPYAGVKWEQMAVDKFLEISGNDPKVGRKILNQTIACNWEGLFKLKKEYSSGESTSATGAGSSKGRSVQSGQVSGKNNQFTIDDFTVPS